MNHTFPLLRLVVVVVYVFSACGCKCGPSIGPTFEYCVIQCAILNLYAKVVMVVDLGDQFGTDIS